MRRVYGTPEGRRVVWESRRHRKGLGLARPGRVPKPLSRFWRLPEGRQNTPIAVLFMIGAALFALGSLRFYGNRVGAEQVGATFFAGALFFTSASYLAYFQVVNAATDPRGRGRATDDPAFWSWEPRRIDWWATAVQLLGTVFFNVSTFAATLDWRGVDDQERFVWAPDALGSIAFLAASAFAYAEVSHRSPLSGRGTTEWWIGVLNALGSIAFGVAAVAAYLVPSTGEPISVTLVNTSTFAGAVCFFVGSYLLVPEAAEIEDMARAA